MIKPINLPSKLINKLIKLCCAVPIQAFDEIEDYGRIEYQRGLMQGVSDASEMFGSGLFCNQDDVDNVVEAYKKGFSQAGKQVNNRNPVTITLPSSVPANFSMTFQCGEQQVKIQMPETGFVKEKEWCPFEKGLPTVGSRIHIKYFFNHDPEIYYHVIATMKGLGESSSSYRYSLEFDNSLPDVYSGITYVGWRYVDE
jgi:hypothetical protein